MDQTLDRNLLIAAHEQTRAAYLQAVSATEQELGCALPRFRGIRFHFVDYTRSTDMAQNPYFRSFPLEQRPVWGLDTYDAGCRAALERFDAQADELREEFSAYLERAGAQFQPADTGYFGADSTWQALDLVEESGRPIASALEQFPRMAERIGQLIELKLICRTYIAQMRPGAHLLPHCGGHTTYLRMHVPLRIPPGDCGIRLGGDVYRWHHGRSLVFDDTFPHEAWNRTEHDRYVLLLRVLHPELSAQERDAYFRIEARFTATPIYKMLIQFRSKLSTGHA